ncbi:hypothetical protein [Nostoc sp.]
MIGAESAIAVRFSDNLLFAIAKAAKSLIAMPKGFLCFALGVPS